MLGSSWRKNTASSPGGDSQAWIASCARPHEVHHTIPSRLHQSCAAWRTRTTEIPSRRGR
jgi:hypothetical protein